MSLLCKAFSYHMCSGKLQSKNSLICCHECNIYDTCEARCNNNPAICNMCKEGEVVKAEKPESDTVVRQVAKYDADTGELLEVYENVKEAQVKNNLQSCRGIYSVIRGDQKTSNGFKWGYVDGQTN